MPIEPPPTDREGRTAWLIEQENRIGRKAALALRRIVRDAWSSMAGLTAAIDPAGLDGIPKAWLTFVEKEMTDDLGELFMVGEMTAWVGLKGQPTDTYAKGWAKIANENAQSYIAHATNRLADTGNATWHLVQGKLASGLRAGLTNEELAKQIDDVGQFGASRAMTIARTEAVGAYVQGDMAGAVALGDKGPVEKVWVATIDPRTRPTHAAAHDQTVPFAAQFEVGGTSMNAPHDPGAPAGEVVHCRCYVEFLYPGDARPDGATIEAPAAAPPVAPIDWVPPPFEGTLTRPGVQPNLGGAHEKIVLYDADGRQVLFKPMPEWQAHGEVAANHIARLGGLDDVPEMWIHTYNGRTGTLQRFVPNARAGFKAGVKFDPQFMTQADAELLQQHRQLDWMIGNHDAHSENWVREGFANAGGKLHGIDKGQAFKHLGEDDLSYSYHPNAKFGAGEPVYNTMERGWAKGSWTPKSDLFSGVATGPAGRVGQTIDRLSAISDGDYRAILRPYARGRFAGDAAKTEKFLADAVARKNSLRADMTGYYKRLNSERAKVIDAAAKTQATANRLAAERLAAEAAARPAGHGAPTGMTAPVSEADTAWMTRYDHPVTPSKPNAAVTTFTGGQYSTINSAMRSGVDHQLASEIRLAMKPVKTDFVVHRGVRMESYSPTGSVDALQGAVLRDRGFMSTSAGGKAAFSGDTLMIIKLPADVGRGAWVRPVSLHKNENEFLIDAGQALFVHKVRAPIGAETYQGFKRVVECEVVSESWAAQYAKTWNTALKAWE